METEGFQIGDLDVAKGILYCGNQKNYLQILKLHRRKGKDSIAACEQLLAKEDWENYTIAVHGIKSAMMSIGAKRLSEMAKALEQAGKTQDYAYIHKEHPAMVAEYTRILNLLEECTLLEIE